MHLLTTVLRNCAPVVKSILRGDVFEVDLTGVTENCGKKNDR